MSVEQAAREYIRLRRLKLDLKAHRNGLHSECGYELGANHLHGGHATACCVFKSREDKSEWCDLCLESDVAHGWFLLASTEGAVALRRLERKVNSATAKPLTKGML